MNKTEEYANVLGERAVTVTLNISTWSGRKVQEEVSRAAEREHGAASGVLHTNKRLMKSMTLDAIGKAASAARVLHNKFTSPWADDGTRLLPTALFFKYAEEMSGAKSKFAELVDSFIDDFDSEVKDAQKSLGKFFNKHDYPTKAQLPDKFYFGYRILEVPNTSDWRVNLPGDEKKRLQEDAKKYVTATFERAVGDVWDRLYKALSNIHQKLSDPDTVFRDSLIDNLGELIELLPALNITGNEELNERTEEAKKIITFKPQVLRTDKIARAAAAQEAYKLIEKVKGYAPSAG